MRDIWAAGQALDEGGVAAHPNHIGDPEGLVLYSGGGQGSEEVGLGLLGNGRKLFIHPLPFGRFCGQGIRCGQVCLGGEVNQEFGF